MGVGFKNIIMRTIKGQIFFIIPRVKHFGKVENGQEVATIHSDIETFDNEEDYNNRLTELNL